jgi:hypothetical protein
MHNITNLPMPNNGTLQMPNVANPPMPPTTTFHVLKTTHTNQHQHELFKITSQNSRPRNISVC